MSGSTLTFEGSLKMRGGSVSSHWELKGAAQWAAPRASVVRWVDGCAGFRVGLVLQAALSRLVS